MRNTGPRQLCSNLHSTLPSDRVLFFTERIYMVKIFAVILLVMSVLTFIVYGLDKHAAKAKTWRTPERRLLLFGFAGGAAGGLLGMLVFHHKTRKFYFWLVNLLGLSWQIIVLWYLGTKLKS